jgi:hypothetical protein
MRFDNPIHDHNFVFPDIAEFPGLEEERIEHTENNSLIDDLNKNFLNPKKFLSIVKNNTNLDNSMLLKIEKYIIFYKHGMFFRKVWV